MTTLQFRFIAERTRSDDNQRIIIRSLSLVVIHAHLLLGMMSVVLSGSSHRTPVWMQRTSQDWLTHLLLLHAYACPAMPTH